MSVREAAEMGMQPLDVAQSGARTAPGCRHRTQNLLLVCFARPGTCSKQMRQFQSIEACASVLTQHLAGCEGQGGQSVVLLDRLQGSEVPQRFHIYTFTPGLDVGQTNVGAQQCF